MEVSVDAKSRDRVAKARRFGMVCGMVAEMPAPWGSKGHFPA